MNRGPQRLMLLALPLVGLASGCHLVIPEVSHQPVVHNPFPQLSRVAVVPFFNQSGEATVDGREFANAYFAELQAIPGFEVVPVSTVEATMRQFGVTFDPPQNALQQARWLADKLGVDAVVIGSVTDFAPYYPPRCGIRVEWYAANEGFHEIPAGYGLPWGTAQEEYIPREVVFEAEMALARAQMQTQSPTVVEPAARVPLDDPAVLPATPDQLLEEIEPEPLAAPHEAAELLPEPQQTGWVGPTAEGAPHEAPGLTTDASALDVASAASGIAPAGWPDARGFTPPGPSPVRPVAAPNPGPVMTHTRVYRGDDPEFTSALAAYVDFRDDARFGGWQSYLTRSEDFIRFCCRHHLVEMLGARGGADETRVVRRWSEGR